jgi:hypothetical protein
MVRTALAVCRGGSGAVLSLALSSCLSGAADCENSFKFVLPFYFLPYALKINSRISPFTASKDSEAPSSDVRVRKRPARSWSSYTVGQMNRLHFQSLHEISESIRRRSLHSIFQGIHRLAFPQNSPPLIYQSDSNWWDDINPMVSYARRFMHFNRQPIGTYNIPTSAYRTGNKAGGLLDLIG